MYFQCNNKKCNRYLFIVNSSMSLFVHCDECHEEMTIPTPEYLLHFGIKD